MELILFYNSFFSPFGSDYEQLIERLVYFYFVYLSLTCYFNVCLQEAVILNYTKPQKQKKKKEPGKYCKMAESENSNSVRQPLNVDAEPLQLSELLDRGWKIFEEVDSTNEPLGSNSIQVKVKRGVQMLEEASRMVAQLDLFSRNEELEEIATADLKYLLLPALLGALTMKQTTRDKRLEIVQTARAYFMDFLRRCEEYKVSQFKLPDSTGEKARPGSEDGNAKANVST